MELSFPAIQPISVEEISHLIQVNKFLINEYSYIKKSKKNKENIAIFMLLRNFVIFNFQGFINKGAVSISLKKPSEKKTNLSHVTLSFSKRPRFLAKNLTAFKKAKGSPNVSFNREILNVSHGVHTASKVF